MYMTEEQSRNYLGTGAANADGQDLQTFLAAYDPSRYQNPCNTVDTLVFTWKECGGKKQISRLLLIQRKNHPSIGWWALPGGFVEFRENLDDAALRELQEETGIADIQIEQLKSYGAWDRDPRTRIITTAYVALVPEDSVRAEAGDDAGNADWFRISAQCTQKDPVQGREQYRLELTGTETGVQTATDLEVTWRPGAILRNRCCRVLKTSLLAADHGALVLDGYQHVQHLLKEEEARAGHEAMECES